ncbi:MAG: ferredoxin [Candidatus Moraniibacteriota bacterium]
MGVKRITICHKRNDCIGCGSCVLLAPKTWKMNAEDGKSDLANAKWKGEEFMVSTIDENEYEENKKAADACPVNIIRLD